MKPNAGDGEVDDDDDEPAEGIQLGISQYPWEGSDRDYLYEEVRPPMRSSGFLAFPALSPCVILITALKSRLTF